MCDKTTAEWLSRIMKASGFVLFETRLPTLELVGEKLVWVLLVLSVVMGLAQSSTTPLLFPLVPVPVHTKMEPTNVSVVANIFEIGNELVSGCCSLSFPFSCSASSLVSVVQIEASFMVSVVGLAADGDPEGMLLLHLFPQGMLPVQILVKSGGEGKTKWKLGCSHILLQSSSVLPLSSSTVSS